MLKHLAELRRRLIVSLVSFVLAFLISYPFAGRAFDVLLFPLLHAWGPGHQVVYTALQEKFFVNVKVASFCALLLSFPLVATQGWKFIAPGLFQHEKSLARLLLFLTPVLFILGISFVYGVVLPVAWRFFLSFEQSHPVIRLLPKVSEYLSLTMHLMFAFGLGFELPVLLLVLVRMGLVTPSWLRQQRRYAFVLCFVVAAFLTPPDPVSQVILALPLYLLYEGGLLLAHMTDKKNLTS